jgi:hypothetical protein
MLSFSVDLTVTERGKKSPKYDVQSDLNGDISFEEFLELMKNTLVTVAIDATSEEQSRGFDKNPVVVVDNRRNKPITEVSPFGKIEVSARVNAPLLFLDMYRDLLKLSPRLYSGYIESHIVTVNGIEIARTEAQLSTWLSTNTLKDRDIVRFVNGMPYAGFLERHGTTVGGSRNQKMVKSTDKRKRAADVNGMVRRANGVYFLVHRSYQRRFKQNMFISFDWMPGNQLGLTQRVGSRQPGRNPMRVDFAPVKPPRRQKYRGYYVYPTITIRIRGEGIA